MRLRSLLAPLPLAAVGAAAFLVAAGAGGSRPPAAGPSPASAWRGLVGCPRAEVAIRRRMLVVLAPPSLADLLARLVGPPDLAAPLRSPPGCHPAAQPVRVA